MNAPKRDVAIADTAPHAQRPESPIHDWIASGALSNANPGDGEPTAGRDERDSSLAHEEAEGEDRTSHVVDARPPVDRRRVIAKKLIDVIGNNPLVSATVAAILAWLIISGAPTLAHRIWPAPPAQTSAELGPISVANTRISLRDFVVEYFDLKPSETTTNDALRAALHAHGLPNDVTDDELHTLGVVVTYDVTYVGLTGRPCKLEWDVYDAATHQPLDDAYLRNQPGFPHDVIVPAAENDHASDDLWLPRPPRPGPFFVHLKLLDDAPVAQRVPLAHADSPQFN